MNYNSFDDAVLENDNKLESIESGIKYLETKNRVEQIYVYVNNDEKRFPVNVKSFLTIEEIIDFYTYVVNNAASGFLIDEGKEEAGNNNEKYSGYSPYLSMIFFNIALVYYYIDNEEIKDLTIADIWNLIGNTNIVTVINNCANQSQIRGLEKAINRFEQMYTRNMSASDEMVSAFAGVVLQLSDGVDKINQIIDLFGDTFVKDGKFKTENLSDIFGLLKEIDGFEVLKNLFGTKKPSLSIKEADNDGSNKEG